MADKVSISGPVEITQSSKEFVALELAKHIALHEKEQNKDRKYWLTLYRHCWKATYGNSLDSLLKPD
jgi:hypothetical protein